MAKRVATSRLDHENWYEEDEPEEPGVFQKASSEVLETRVIKTAKRHSKQNTDSDSDSKPSPFSHFTGFGSGTSTSTIKSPFSFLNQKASSEVPETRLIKAAKRHSKQNTDSDSDSKPSPFSHFTGFGSGTSTSTIKSPFSFLNQNKAKVSDDGDKNGTKEQNTVSSLTKESQPQFKSFTNSIFNSDQSKESLNFSSDLMQKNPTTTDSTFKPFEHIFKAKPVENSNVKTKILEQLKDLNLSCSSWIAEHLEKNPYCILTPIFKDYEKHLAQLGLDTYSDEKDSDIVLEKTNTASNSITENTKSCSSKKEETTRNDSLEKDKEQTKTTDFKFESLQPNPSFTFQFNSNKNSLGATNTPFSLNKIASKPVEEESDSKNDDESEEPPKNDFVPVIEEDSIFDIKCKVFVKKEGNFVSRGVGTLFLKPVKDSTKTQLIVRAHTSLGNILLNILLASGMPIQKTGKNNAMIVCIPTPESKPPPVPVLIRVKTSEECDTLIKKLEECRGS